MPKKKAAQRNNKVGKGGGGGKQNNSGPSKTVSESNKTAVTTSSTAANPGTAETRTHYERRCKKGKNRKNGGMDLDAHFLATGLTVRTIDGDGNCLFRAFADQMEGNQNNHRHYRLAVLEHIKTDVAWYATFHEQDEEKDFEERLRKLARNGTYGGQECIVAFARVFNRLVYVHQPYDKVVFQLPPTQSADPQRLQQVHIVYTGGNHYQSLRLLSDDKPGPARVHVVMGAPAESPAKYSRSTASFSDFDMLDNTGKGIIDEVLENQAEDDEIIFSETTVVGEDSGVDSPGSRSRETSPFSRSSHPSDSNLSATVSQVLIKSEGSSKGTDEADADDTLLITIPTDVMTDSPTPSLGPTDPEEALKSVQETPVAPTEAVQAAAKKNPQHLNKANKKRLKKERARERKSGLTESVVEQLTQGVKQLRLVTM